MITRSEAVQRARVLGFVLVPRGGGYIAHWPNDHRELLVEGDPDTVVIDAYNMLQRMNTVFRPPQ